MATQQDCCFPRIRLVALPGADAVTKETARAFYEIEAARRSWRWQLERQIGVQRLERLDGAPIAFPAQP